MAVAPEGERFQLRRRHHCRHHRSRSSSSRIQLFGSLATPEAAANSIRERGIPASRTRSFCLFLSFNRRKKQKENLDFEKDRFLVMMVRKTVVLGKEEEEDFLYRFLG